MLSEKEKIVYDEIVEAYLQFETEMTTSVKDIKMSEFQKAFDAVVLDHPEIFWSRTYSATSVFGKINTSKKIRLNYFFSKNNAIEIKKEIEPIYNSIIEEAKTYSTDYEKIKFVHDKLIDMGTYTLYTANEEAKFQSFVSIFQDGRTVCSGFAYSFKYIMDNLGIDSIIIVDINEEERKRITYLEYRKKRRKMVQFRYNL